mmetsp:Transcript_20155/g.23240  ORF Transcript_20155/g.23240 Transcript_20155/m.23240 type:complete len:80 (-) Transcript_20155:203-442(-)
MSAQYTKAQVALHNSEEDFWVIYRKEVFHIPADVIRSHPGGEIILDAAGQDGTIMFEDGPHGDAARDMMKLFRIGSLIE